MVRSDPEMEIASEFRYGWGFRFAFRALLLAPRHGAAAEENPADRVSIAVRLS